MRGAGFDVSAATVDVSSRESVHALVETATTFGDVIGSSTQRVYHPARPPRRRSSAVDLYGTALVLEELGNVIASGGAGVVTNHSAVRGAAGELRPTSTSSIAATSRSAISESNT